MDGKFGRRKFLKGTQTKYDFVPEQSTDFIFCTIGEEWGFVGSFVLILLFNFPESKYLRESKFP